MVATVSKDSVGKEYLVLFWGMALSAPWRGPEWKPMGAKLFG